MESLESIDDNEGGGWVMFGKLPFGRSNPDF